jgi:hypothetical protein
MTPSAVNRAFLGALILWLPLFGGLGGPGPALADGWIGPAAEYAEAGSWVHRVQLALMTPQNRLVFRRDPRPVFPTVLRLLNRAEAALHERNGALARDCVREAVQLIDRGVARGYYSRPDAEPIKGSILGYVPWQVWTS